MTIDFAANMENHKIPAEDNQSTADRRNAR
jgi:hypothetical protein